MNAARPHPAFSLRLPAALAAVLLLGAGACQAEPRDLRTAQVEGRRLAYQVLGHDRPALVLISGLGDGMASFKAVAPDLARSATVILYDRAGYGDSDPAATPRDAAAADRELLGLLKASGVPGPYVIAGHSLGGLYAEYFAAHHPDLTAALILEESRPADFTRRCEAAKIGLCAPPPALARLMPKAAQAEIAALDATAAEVADLPPARSLPVLVLSRSLPRNAKPFDALWAQAQDDLAARYGAQHLTAPAGGHYVHKDQRDWFLAQVTAFLAKVSRSAPPTAGSRPGPGTR
ncbi:alpha/beta fold hydrolase [Phenylobacterium aquaticum]|uniref:alpha/beta fold hydrolase n=1 Tax=Phenylobacterium aquaticum TaxID=1763816 RepID=UPI001F5C25F4|nr:alpha/beta hydrolase [Phenylobacterium aquaticum]MCI3135228.1 alpha/beta hydrolase [Phenylobacterium aquaticum]